MRALHPALRPKVGATVPGAEDPCYASPEGLAYSFCRMCHLHPEKPYCTHMPKNGRPHILFPKQFAADARQKAIEEKADKAQDALYDAQGVPWYDRPLGGNAEHHLYPIPDAQSTIGRYITPKNLALAAVAAFIGVKVL